MGYERNDRPYGGDRYRGENRDQGRGYGYGDRSYYGVQDRGYGRSAYGERGRDDRGYGNDRYGRDRGYERDDDRGFFDRAGDEVRSWFGDEDAERRRREDERRDQREWERSGGRDDWTAYAGYGLGAEFGGLGYGAFPTSGDYGRSNEGRHRNRSRGAESDPHYRSWRDRQIDSLDRDYDEYRQQNQSRFENEFATWRTGRQSQRDALSRVQEHQEVVGSDGEHIGTVDHIRGDRIRLTKNDKDAGGHHHSIPSSWIESVDDKIKITKTAEQAKAHWKDEDRNGGSAQWDRGRGDDDRGGGARYLNRSFSGTY